MKVLRPHVEAQFARDLRDMYLVAGIAERWSAEARRLRLIEVVDTLARTGGPPGVPVMCMMPTKACITES